MKPPTLDPSEERRLEALRRYGLLDSVPQHALDDLVSLAASICATPMAYISFIDERAQRFRSTVGLSMSEAPRDVSLCAHVIAQPDLLVVPDAAQDDRFAGSPLVIGPPHIRFHACAPVVTTDGHALGTIAVSDRVPRELMPSQAEALRVLSRQVMSQLDLHRQARELAEHESRLFEVLRSCPFGVSIHRLKDRTFVDVNDEFTNLFGWTREELVGRTTTDLDIVDETVARQIRSTLALTPGRSTFTVVARTRSGEARHVLMGTVLAEVRGDRYVIATFVDLTSIRRAEAAQRSDEARYRTLFELAPDGIVIANQEGYYIDANAAACRMLGYGRDELLTLHASAIVATEEVPRLAKGLEAAKSGLHSGEWTFRRKDGSVFPADVVATRMPDGNPLGMIRDITGRKQAEDALRAAEERMRFALEAAKVGIWDLDCQTGGLRWSSMLEEQFGLQPGAFRQTLDAFVELVHPDDRAAVLETVRDAMSAGADFSLEYRVVWPDGTVRWIAGAGRFFLGDDGQPVRGVGIAQDATDRRTLEAQYLQAQRLEAVGRLAGGVAHDFNNLLTAILGYCELLLSDLDAHDFRYQDIREIQGAGQRAARLTGQLLAFSRKQIVESVRLDLNAIVTDMRGMLARLIGEDVQVVVTLEPNLAAIRADRGQIEQVVMNLAVNARDAMPNGGTLTIETASIDLDEEYPKTHLSAEPGPYVVLTVTDTGTGMTPEVQAHLFEPFFTTKDPGKGTGLGLATVFGIVKRSGGGVGVYSETGKGTAFKVYLPRAEAAVVDATPRPPEPAPALGRRAVLVVDDEVVLRELAKRMLERLGFQVHVAGGADGGLRHLRA